MYVLLLVTSHNSLSQRVSLLLTSLGINYTIEYAISESVMEEAVSIIERKAAAGKGERLDLVICPFLTKKVPATIYDKYLTLIIHPGPPGDSGPSALDWVLAGDLGEEENSSKVLDTLFVDSTGNGNGMGSRKMRGYWGVTVLQAIEALDEGPVWAFEQFKIPETATKSSLYRDQVTKSACLALMSALQRIQESSNNYIMDSSNDSRDSLEYHPYPPSLIAPKDASILTSRGYPFLGGKTHNRPLLKPLERALNPTVHTAARCVQIIRAGDSQPGSMVRWLDKKEGKKCVFLYGGWLQSGLNGEIEDWENLDGNMLGDWESIPNGSIVATRDGAILVKAFTFPPGSDLDLDSERDQGVAFWITHARLPISKVTKLLPPKLPAVDALISGGMGDQLKGVPEWKEGWVKKEGTWQEIWMEKEYLVGMEGGVALYAYFDFYNGACSTKQCQALLNAIITTVEKTPEPVRVLVLMGSVNYFSNGIALNVIEGTSAPADESWANINAIDDIVEYIIGDSSTGGRTLRSTFLLNKPTLAERGIVTVAAIQSNAAAGGFALATCADIVLCTETATLNPHYRGVGLFGSEYHTYHWKERAGEAKLKEMSRGMLPLSARDAKRFGLVDEVVGNKMSSVSEIDAEIRQYVRGLAWARVGELKFYNSAPWTRPLNPRELLHPTDSLLNLMVDSKLAHHAGLEQPLLVYRNEELSNMLLDFHHPIRSVRYHSRREAFVRKFAPKATPLRFAKHRRVGEDGVVQYDIEERDSFDDAPDFASRASISGSRRSKVSRPATAPTDEQHSVGRISSPKYDHRPDVPPKTPTGSMRGGDYSDFPITPGTPITPSDDIPRSRTTTNQTIKAVNLAQEFDKRSLIRKPSMESQQHSKIYMADGRGTPTNLAATRSVLHFGKTANPRPNGMEPTRFNGAGEFTQQTFNESPLGKPLTRTVSKPVSTMTTKSGHKSNGFKEAFRKAFVREKKEDKVKQSPKERKASAASAKLAPTPTPATLPVQIEQPVYGAIPDHPHDIVTPAVSRSNSDPESYEEAMARMTDAQRQGHEQGEEKISHLVLAGQKEVPNLLYPCYYGVATEKE